MAQAAWLLIFSLLLFDPSRLSAEEDDDNECNECKEFWRKSKTGNDDKECDSYPNKEKLNNLLLIDSAYCFNNGSGICKAINGRFEFLFNVFEDKVIGPVGPSEHVDNFGYHKRVPRAYNTKGEILYHDRSINWARSFKKSIGELKINLLLANQFNWCSYVGNDWWPYKSALKDPRSKFAIYFYNRQTCILKTEGNRTQHLIKRFPHNSSLRIDLDANPTIFLMEDNEAKEVRMVKHMRQHWYEVEYRMIEAPIPAYRYFVSINQTQREPCIITGKDGRHILSRRAYRNFTKICLTDQLSKRRGKNSKLLTYFCGYEQIEIADYPSVIFNDPERKGLIHEVGLHSIPRHPIVTESFYGVNVRENADWEIFAKDGFVFAATTTIPVENSKDKVRVISLYARYLDDINVDPYKEDYPVPYLSDYIAIYNRQDNQRDWSVVDREQNSKKLKNLNYVDDIAYLYKCKTILVILGPLYSEYPADKFSLQSRAPIDSIYELGMWELTSAFFAMPDESDIFWAYHRLNYIASYKYTCSKGPGKLVTAKRTSEYLLRYAAKPAHPFRVGGSGSLIETVDETFMHILNIYKGDFKPREPPDPALFPIGEAPPRDIVTEYGYTALFIVLGISLPLIVIMGIICLFTFKQRRGVGKHGVLYGISSLFGGRRKATKRNLAGGLHPRPTRSTASRRVSTGTSSQTSQTKTPRSAMAKGFSASNSRSSPSSTARSSMRSGSNKPSSSRASSSKTPRPSIKLGSSAKITK